MGGNKVRKLEYLLAQAQTQGCDTVFTTGGAQSNHAMLTAACAKKLGMEPILILKKRGVTERKGNQLLEYLMDTDVRFMDTDSYDDIYAEMDRVGQASGKKYYKIPCGGSNAIGMLHPFVEDEGVRLVGVEAGGTGEPGCYNSAPINLGSPGVLHGHVTMLLQDKDGQIQPSHSISAGLDYPGVGPEHAYLAETGRVHYGMICDASALNAFQTLTREEGIIPALESSHAVAWVLDHAEELPQGCLLYTSPSPRDA